MSLRIQYKILILLGIYTLTSCSAVDTLNNWDPTEYTVRSGDTIYSIAWRYELDHKQLAEWNNLDTPDFIRPGQRLRMQKPRNQHAYVPVEDTPDEQTVIMVARENVRLIEVKNGDTLYSLAKDNNLTVEQLAKMNALEAPYHLAPGRKLRVIETVEVPQKTAHTGGQSGESKSTLGSTIVAKKPFKSKGKIKWSWPVQGKLIGKFNSRKIDAKGIDIKAAMGTPVKAAAEGRVVYSGNGLINYGNLVIIKHSAVYLSAYAHNKTLLVKEGQEVKAGQLIAKLGNSGAESPRLHFEIRHKGKPVDPLRYLPGS